MWWRRFSSLARGIADSYSEILFMQRAWPGVLMLAATFTVPSVGISGLVSVAAAYAFARFIGMERRFLDSGFFTYNALLTGLGIGALFQVTPLSLLLSATAGVMSLNLSLMLDSLFRQYLRLPILSLPFVFISMVVYLASLGYSNLLMREGDGLLALADGIPLPAVVEGFLRALGAILFLPHALTGFIFGLVLLWYSRILFLLALGGYLLGAATAGVLGGSWQGALLDFNNFNYVLIAMALGGVFLVPSRASLAIAAIGVLLAALLMGAVELFWSLYGLPAFTLPFNLVTLSLLYVLGLVGFPAVADRIGVTPEETLDDHLGRRARFPLQPRRVLPPFSGCWKVWQGFDGPWTHQGAQAHALDFVIERDGRSHRGDGLELGDYHAWRKPVLSPVRGRVAMVRDGVPDNPPGAPDREENWGNWVSIDTGLGWHVVLAHFAQGSVAVQPGDWVEPGARLGLCGNSGYSPQPHIHMHVQAGPQPGEATLPFLVESLVRDGSEYVDAAVPEAGTVIEPLYPDARLADLTAFVLDGRWRIEWRPRAGRAERRTLRVRMNEQGETCFDSGRGRLFFYRTRHQFHFYRLEGRDPLLARWFRLLPRLPLVARDGLHWEDVLPLAAGPARRRWLLDLARVLHPALGMSRYRARRDGEQVLGVVSAGREHCAFSLRIERGPRFVFDSCDGCLEIAPEASPDSKPEVP